MKDSGIVGARKRPEPAKRGVPRAGGRDRSPTGKAPRPAARAAGRARLPPGTIGLFPDAAVVTRGGVIAEANPAMARMMGAPGPEALVGLAPTQVVDPASLAVVEEQVRLGLEVGEMEPHEVILRGLDGGERHAEVRGVVLDDPGGVSFLLTLRDVTDRRRAERELRLAVQRYETLLELSPVAAFVNRGNRIEQVNAAFLRLLGARFAEEVVGRPPLDFFEAKDHEAIRKRIRRALAGDSLAVATFRVVRLDGAVREVETVSSLVQDARGKALQVVLRDVTESRLALRALRESEQLFRSVIENLSDGIHVLDLRTGRYVFASSALVAMTGLPEAELRGMTAQEALERVHPEDRELALVHERAIAAGETALGTIEYRWKRGSGDYRWFADTRTVVRDAEGRPSALVGASRDITDRKRAEEYLRQSEARFRALTFQAPIGVLETDLEGKTRFVNPALERITMRTRETLQGTRFRDLIHPEDRAVLPTLESWDPDREPERVYWYRVCRPDGTLRRVRGHAVALRGADGRPYGLMAVLFDLTDFLGAGF